MLTASELGAQALPGSKPGTEQWIVTLRSRGFDLKQKLREIRAQPTRLAREQKLAELEQTTAQDQADVKTFVAGLGGTLTRSFWVVNACAVEVQPDRLAALRGHARTRALWPNEARGPCTVWDATMSVPTTALPPIGESTDEKNHNAVGAYAVPTPIGSPPKGEKVTVAIFDSGLDREFYGGTTANPHPAWYADSGQVIPPAIQTLTVPGTGAKTRLWESFKVTEIDCNDASVDPFQYPCSWTPPTPYNRTAFHGTGVGSIAVGKATFSSAQGHAPRSLVVGWSITQRNNGSIMARWIATPTTYLTAATAMLAWLVADPIHDVHILNISFGGWPDPDHPVSATLDWLSSDLELDILVVVAAGNEGDASSLSHGCHNAISVGAVHKRTDPVIDPTYWPMADTSRGPLFGDPERFFPDVCATGAGKFFGYSVTSNACDVRQIQMAPIDYDGGSPTIIRYDGRGTSMAAPQVAGAAALYRARRLNHSPVVSNSALETKAALLLNVDDPFAKLASQDPTLPETTYRARNTYGVGYTRDDWVVEYAERLASIYPIGQQVTLGGGTTTQTLAYNVRAGQRYAVVAAWFRHHFDADPPPPLPNVDLEVLDGSTKLAVSKTPRNSYERVVFEADGDPLQVVPVTIRVTLQGPDTPGPFPVYVAGRELADQTLSPLARAGYSLDVEQAPGCVGSGTARAVNRMLPSSYAQAYGSWPIGITVGAGAKTRPSGFPLGDATATTTAVNALYHPVAVGGDFDAVGIALRTWKPFAGTTGTLEVNRLYLYEFAFWPPQPGHLPPPTVGAGYGGVSGVSNLVQVIGQTNPLSVNVNEPTWTADKWGVWHVFMPFDAGMLFQYRGFSANPQRALGVYWETDTSALPESGYEVDWVADGSSNYYANYSSYPSVQPYAGQAPLLGVVEPEPAGDLPPVLSLVGEPRIAEDAVFLIQQGPPGGYAVLYVGPPMDQPGHSGCRKLVGTDFQPWGPGALDGDGAGSLKVLGATLTDPALLRLDLHWQAWVWPAGTWSFSLSNGLITRFGGLYR